MNGSKRFALGALAWSTLVAVGLGACGGGGGGGAGSPSVGSGSTSTTADGSVVSSAASTPTGAGATSGAVGTTGAGATAGGGTTTVTGTPAGTGTSSTAAATASSAVMLGDCEMFPSQAVFNTRIDDTTRFPAQASSASWIASVGSTTPFRADWGTGVDPTQRNNYYGIPFNLVDGTASTTNWATLQYDFTPSGVSTAVGWPHESDCAVPNGSGYTLTRGCSTVPATNRRFPIPTATVLNEGGTCNDPNTCGDHHLAVVEQGACRLWEAYSAYKLGSQWYALSTAAWDLKSLALRPSTWTSGDAAGLPITPFLAKAAEASSGEIRHALRVTFRDAAIANSFVWPARHSAGSTAGSIPFGALLRLRADFVIPDNWTTQAKAIATAAKRYGLYVADIGMDFYVQGEPSAAWDTSTFSQLATIPLSQMEFVDMGNVTRDPRFSADSMAASW
ncbi:hypothetical protein ACPWT1_06520 [Ramlibacter sp. MMS24-I3-19]|uniref:hypothetical protein n=1 Tax=Ramlibacter sp. MMS24-I3-19 TaxID=3416606 RepID=UPI003CFF793A